MTFRDLGNTVFRAVSETYFYLLTCNEYPDGQRFSLMSLKLFIISSTKNFDTGLLGTNVFLVIFLEQEQVKLPDR